MLRARERQGFVSGVSVFSRATSGFVPSPGKRATRRQHAGDEYGGTGQGAYGDESYDPSYQRERETVEAIDPDAGLSVLADLPADHEGPGRGEGGGEWTGQRPLESPEDILRRGFDGAAQARRRDDATIDDDVRDALATTPEIRGDVMVAVERGEVTFTGTVPDDASRNAAHRRVAEIPGVTAIVDRIRVRHA